MELVNGATSDTIGAVFGTGNVITGNTVIGWTARPGTSGNGILGIIEGLDPAGAVVLGNSQAGVAVGRGRPPTSRQ